MGVSAVFRPGTAMQEIIDFIASHVPVKAHDPSRR
jgi:hypothetical protein